MNFREIPQPVPPPEAANAGLSAHQIFRPGDLASAHAAFAAPAPGAESALAALPGANEPISPLIQLIMRMPGQLGLMSSFFEAIGNFILPHAQALGFDPAMFGGADFGGAPDAGLASGEHFAIDPSLLPDDAPIFTADGGDGAITAMTRLDGGALAGSQPFNIHSRDALGELLADPRNVGGDFDPRKAMFEPSGESEVLSGPSLSEGANATHLSGAQRLFADHPGRGGFGSMLASSSGTAAVTPAQTVPISSASAVPSDLHVNGSPLGQSDASSAVGIKDAIAPLGGENAGYQLGSSDLGPSGMVGDKLGSDQQLLAMDKSSQAFKPTLGSMQGGNDYGANYIQTQPDAGHAAHSGADSGIKALKAQQLTLDGKPALDATSTAQAHAKQAIESHATAAKSATTHASTPSHSNTTANHHTSHAQPAHKAHDQISHRSFQKVAYSHPTAKIEAPQAQAPEAQAQDGQTYVDGQQIASSEVQAQAGDTQIAQPQPTTYTIRAGDCLWNIAKDQLGAGTRWEEIYKINADVLGTNPDMIYAGTTIQLPGAGPELASHSLNSAGHYIVKPGDNLWNISKEYLGGGDKWGEIYRANTDVIGSNPSLIFPGQELNIPGMEGASATVADAGSATAGAAGQQVATTASAAVPTAGVPEVQMPEAANYGTQGTMDSAAAAQTDVPQMTTDAPQALSQQTQQMMPQQAPVTAVPAAHPTVPGPGAAAAATVSQPLVPGPEMGMQDTPPVVSSSLAGDLSNFLAKRR